MAYTVLDSKNIDKKKNIYTFGGSGTKPEREDIAENSKLIDYSSGEKYYYDPTKAAGSKWQPDKEPSGGGSSGSIPANFPKEGSANANKFAGFDENGLWTAKDAPSGGGAEKFVVTLTEENDIWTADKTIAEIVAADAANKIVVAHLNFNNEMVSGGAPVEIPMSIALSVEGSGFVSFGGVLNLAGTEKAVSVFGLSQSSETSWQVGVTQLGSTLAPLVVTLTENSGTLTGNKTYQEVKEARLAGRPVDLVMEGYTCSSVLDVNDGESSISVSFIALGQLMTATGAPNDYVSKTLG